MGSPLTALSGEIHEIAFRCLSLAEKAEEDGRGETTTTNRSTDGAFSEASTQLNSAEKKPIRTDARNLNGRRLTWRL